MQMVSTNYLSNIKSLFNYYKSLGDKSLAQLDDEQIHLVLLGESNSIAIIVKHMSGNMLSRWTDFLQTDGEKSWRNREQEFQDTFKSKAELLKSWEQGWQCFFAALEDLQPVDLERIVFIRNEGHSVMEAINRQLAHYAYHVGQLVFVAKALKGSDWQGLSIARGASDEFNAKMFAREKRRKNII